MSAATTEHAPGGVIDDALSADLAAAALLLARRFAAGGTLWCIAPEWEPHANHVAVEFVHPVIVGKKALPAVALTGPDLVGAVRVSVRPGDVVVAVASANEPSVRSVMCRAPAWGVSTLWIGSGERPSGGAADRVLWLADPDPRLPATGAFVLLYHLLWELTHVCFEHPGLLTVAPDGCAEQVCLTCSDEGRLAEVVDALDPASALVRAAGGQEHVNTILLGAVEPGELVLVHAGMAISKLDEGPAR